MSIQETFHGYIETTQDTLLIFEACRRGMLPRIQRRLQEKERKIVRSGTVFVFDERESGIKRWTDGLVWSPSRILDNFLIYRELDKRAPPGSKDKPAPLDQRPRQRSASDADTTAEKHKERALVGSLTNSYRFKKNGLIKKTMSIVVGGVAQHMISYYSKEDVLAGKLRTPSSVPELAGLEISPEFLVKQNFRIPPELSSPYDAHGDPMTSPTSETPGPIRRTSNHRMVSEFGGPGPLMRKSSGEHSPLDLYSPRGYSDMKPSMSAYNQSPTHTLFSPMSSQHSPTSYSYNSNTSQSDLASPSSTQDGPMSSSSSRSSFSQPRTGSPQSASAFSSYTPTSRMNGYGQPYGSGLPMTSSAGGGGGGNSAGHQHSEYNMGASYSSPNNSYGHDGYGYQPHFSASAPASLHPLHSATSQPPYTTSDPSPPTSVSSSTSSSSNVLLYPQESDPPVTLAGAPLYQSAPSYTSEQHSSYYASHPPTTSSSHHHGGSGVPMYGGSHHSPHFPSHPANFHHVALRGEAAVMPSNSYIEPALGLGRWNDFELQL